MEDKEWRYSEFQVFVKDGKVNITDGEHDIFIGALDGGRFEALKDAIAYINAMNIIEGLNSSEVQS